MTIKQFIENNHKAYRDNGEGLSTDVMLSQIIEALDTLESKHNFPSIKLESIAIMCVLELLEDELLRRGFNNNDPT